MDIKAYIQSGIIESYVLGIAGADEVNELESLKQEYPEIQQAIDEFGLALEQQAFDNAVHPPAEVKHRLLTELDLHDEVPSADNSLTVAYKSGQAGDNADTNRAKISMWRSMAAAAIIFLVVSAAANVYLYNRYNSTRSQYQALLTERNTLEASNQIYQTKLNQYQQATAMMADPAYAHVEMKDPTGKAENMTTVFWNRNTKEVYLMANKLPSPSADQQYQLWALVDGKPVDAGMLDAGCTSLCKMKDIPRAQAFAITLEKAGGSPEPHLDQLYVMGNI